MLCIAPTLLLIGTLTKDEMGRRKIDPNPATFFIRSVAAWINLATYFTGSGTTWVRSSVLIASSVSLTTIFIITFFVCRIRMVRWLELVTLVLSSAVGVAWYKARAVNPITANLLMQCILVISMAPQIWRIYKLQERQVGLPWAFATGAYVCMTTALFIDPLGFKPFQLVNPIVPGVICNGLLMIFSYRQERLLKLGHVISFKAP
jgi:drug/metabolite transporter (DMT)-like permease